MQNWTHIAPHLLQENVAPAGPAAQRPPGKSILFFCDAEVYVRPMKVADGKPQAYEAIVAKNCELVWNSADNDLEKLELAFAKVCVSRQDKSMEAIIRAAATSKKNPGSLSVYVNAFTGFLKGSKVLLTQENLPTVLAVMEKSPKKKAGLIFSMKNPGKNKEEAAKAEITEMATQQAARKLKRVKKPEPIALDAAGEDSVSSGHESDSSSDSGDSADDPVSAFMNRLFSRHPMNMEYNPVEPVVIDPTDPNRYFILTHSRCRTWAQLRDVDGVGILNPPPCLKYDLVKKPAGRGAGEGSGAGGGGGLDPLGVTQLVVGVIAGLEAHREARVVNAPPADAGAIAAGTSTTRNLGKRRRASESPPPSSSPPYTAKSGSIYGVHTFLEICGWEGDILEQYKSKLASLGIVDFRMLNEHDTPLTAMAGLGFNEITSRMIYKNVGKYARRLERERKAKENRHG